MTLRPLALAFALAIGTSLSGAAMPASAQTPSVAGYAVAADSTLLSVSATAEASRVPDIATISTGVVT